MLKSIDGLSSIQRVCYDLVEMDGKELGSKEASEYILENNLYDFSNTKNPRASVASAFSTMSKMTIRKNTKEKGYITIPLINTIPSYPLMYSKSMSCADWPKLPPHSDGFRDYTFTAQDEVALRNLLVKMMLYDTLMDISATELKNRIGYLAEYRKFDFSGGGCDGHALTDLITRAMYQLVEAGKFRREVKHIEQVLPSGFNNDYDKEVFSCIINQAYGKSIHIELEDETPADTELVELDLTLTGGSLYTVIDGQKYKLEKSQ